MCDKHLQGPEHGNSEGAPAPAPGQRFAQSYPPMNSSAKAPLELFSILRHTLSLRIKYPADYQ